MRTIRAIIADDEEALRVHLRNKLARFWPELAVEEARDGDEALRLIREHKPDISFLDIRMPGRTGIDVAREAGGACLIVFVTAYDRYALDAFESEAIDYLLKPVSDDRLKKTVKRLKDRLAGNAAAPDLSAMLEKLSHAMKKPTEHLQWIKAQHKDGVRLVPVKEIHYFKATDKYTTLRTRDDEFLIRTSLKELEDALDPELFWRVHRGALVNVSTINTVKRSIAGTLTIGFKDIPDRLTVSRANAHLFKQM